MLIAGVIVYVFAASLPHENALALAADGKLQLTTVWGYRFRHADLLGMAYQPDLLLALLKFSGVKAFWCAVILLQTLILASERRILRGIFACTIAAGIVFAPGLVLWSAALSGLIVAVPRLRSLLRSAAPDAAGGKPGKILRAVPVTLATATFIYAALWLANPLYHVHRQRVLGGRSFRDGTLAAEKGDRLQLRETCLAVINPDDLRAVSSLEKISLASLRAMPALALIDLKVVEANYRLLTLRDEKGVFVFTDEARAFAAAEKKHSEKLLPPILAAGNVCLIANFETLPDAETPPFSRARGIYEQRKKAGLATRIIQLPNQ